MTRVRKNRNLFDMARQRHRGGALEGCKNSSSKRIVLVRRDNNKVLVDINKKGGRNRPAINLKHLNQFIPYQYFKMEGMFCLREMLQKDYFMCKPDMKDAYFQ